MQSFLADYGALIAPVAAIVNGFIAVVVAQFFKDHRLAKVLLVVAAGVLGAAAIGATILSQRQLVEAKREAQARQAETREGLGKFIAEGLVIASTACSGNSAPPRWDQLADWQKRLSQFLQDRLGKSYATRLRSPAGAPLNVTCQNADAEHEKFYRVMNIFNFRLEQFAGEISARP